MQFCETCVCPRQAATVRAIRRWGRGEAQALPDAVVLINTNAMKIARYSLPAAIVFSTSLFLAACSSHKRCGMAVEPYKIHGSKRYKESIKERDSLCNLVSVLKSDSAMRGDRMRALTKRYDDLNKGYNSLQRNATAEVAGLNSDLADRDRRLRQLESSMRRQDSLMNALTSTVRNALIGFSPDELSVNMKNGKIYVSMSDKLLFQSGSDVVETKGQDALKKLAVVLFKNPDIDIFVEGHTDSIPIKTARYKDNWDLSSARATSVIRLLASQGLDSRRLTASGRGEYYPVSSNSTPEGRQKNRRTEIILSPKLDLLMKYLGYGS